jgi:GntR family phosphonate transport system transcriptional regulator
MTKTTNRTGNRRGALQRGAGISLWRQIADEIRVAIASGLAAADGRLPPEHALAARFGVNRHTVRAAISALSGEGVLQAVQGRGTYVRRRRKLSYPIGERTRFSAALEEQNQSARTELLSHSAEAADEDVATALGLSTGSRTIRLEVLGRADDLPVSRATFWFPEHRFPGLIEVFARTGSVTATIREFGVADYIRASTRIEARHADQADSEMLGLSPGAILLVATSINVDMDGTPLQYSCTRFPADRVDLVVARRSDRPSREPA